MSDSKSSGGAPKLVIVGGGTAGWMTACYLNQIYNSHAKHVDITLVESSDIGVVGVGEATVHSLRLFLSSINVPEKEFLTHTNATLKHGVMFKNWRMNGNGAHQYFHPFEYPRLNDGASLIEHWNNLRQKNATVETLDSFASFQTKLAQNNFSPKIPNSKDYDGLMPYGYHLDAILFGQYLRGVATSRGVERIEDDVVKTEVTEHKQISQLVCKSGKIIQGDFFVDCTGFASILMRALKNDDFVSYSDSLLCDRAVTTRIGFSDDHILRPYTSSSARDAGWVWDIDLFDRRGIGYVYSSQFQTPEEAEQTLRKYVGASNADVPLKHLKMRVGRRKRAWVGNCVSIGLSAGFIEPLESTGIYFIDMGVRLLGEYLPLRKNTEAVANAYNNVLSKLYDQTKDFIVLHYLLSNRTDKPFWRASREDIKVSDALQEKLLLWKSKTPSPSDFADQVALFTHHNFSYVMYGLEFAPVHDKSSTVHIPIERSLAIAKQKKRIEDDLLKKVMPAHKFIDTAHLK